MSAALQMLDMDEAPATWCPPKAFIDLDRISGLPQHGVGRGLKVGKEEVIGLLTALERFASTDRDDDVATAIDVIEALFQGLSPIDGLEVSRIEDTRWGWPRLELRLGAANRVGSVVDMSLRLKQGTPPVYLYEQRLTDGVLIVDPANLAKTDVPRVIEAVRAACSTDPGQYTDQGGAT